MSENRRIVAAPLDDVWEVLRDGWLYPLWVVGASRMREVDDGWPAVGTRLHHSVGSWPLLIDDTTEVLEVEDRSRLLLKARAWPAGDAIVEIELIPSAAGQSTEVVMREDAHSGPARLVPSALRQPPLVWRNTESLRRLAFLAERRQ